MSIHPYVIDLELHLKRISPELRFQKYGIERAGSNLMSYLDTPKLSLSLALYRLFYRQPKIICSVSSEETYAPILIDWYETTGRKMSRIMTWKQKRAVVSTNSNLSILMLKYVDLQNFSFTASLIRGLRKITKEKLNKP